MGRKNKKPDDQKKHYQLSDGFPFLFIMDKQDLETGQAVYEEIKKIKLTEDDDEVRFIYFCLSMGFIYVSRNFEKMFNFPAHEMYHNGFLGIEQLIYPDDASRFFGIIAHYIRPYHKIINPSTEPSSLKVHVRMIKPDNSLRWVQWEMSTGHISKTEGVMFYCCKLTDISGMKTDNLITAQIYKDGQNIIINTSKIGDGNNILTPKELEVANLMKEGLLWKEIADKLGMSVNTVHNHRKNIYNKLEVKDKANALIKLRKLGIV